MAWSIAAAMESNSFDEVMVSTDDLETAEVARKYGASVPFFRSTRNADDHATTAAVLIEVINAYRTQGKIFDTGCCIYPTAPFVTAKSLRMGLEMLGRPEIDFVLPVTQFSFPIWRSLQRESDGQTKFNWPEHRNMRSQDLPAAYHDAGQWYCFRTKALLDENTLLGARTASIILPNTEVQDIDTEEDWSIAEMKHALLFTE